MKELWRIPKPSGTLRIKIPNYTHCTSWENPTHYLHCSSHALLHFTQLQSTVFYRCRCLLISLQLRCSAFPAHFLQAIHCLYGHKRYLSKIFPVQKIIAEFRKEFA